MICTNVDRFLADARANRLPADAMAKLDRVCTAAVGLSFVSIDAETQYRIVREGVVKVLVSMGRVASKQVIADKLIDSGDLFCSNDDTMEVVVTDDFVFIGGKDHPQIKELKAKQRKAAQAKWN